MAGNGYHKGFRSAASFGFGGQESASKPPQAICKPLAVINQMNTKNLILIMFCLFLNLISTAQDNEQIKDLRLILDITVVNLDSSILIENAKIEIIGTDSSSITIQTDSKGFTSTNLKPNTSYIIKVSASGYLNCIGKETTIGIENSMRFIHNFKMSEIEKCVLYGPSISYNINDYQHPKDSLYPDNDVIKSYFNIISENDYWKFQITGFCESNEKFEISKKRARYFRKQLVKMGIPKSRIKIDFKKSDVTALESQVPSLQDKSEFSNNRQVLLGIIYE